MGGTDKKWVQITDVSWGSFFSPSAPDPTSIIYCPRLQAISWRLKFQM
jgi:hypothetical protein